MFILPYPLEEAPSQRFRFEQYIPLLKDNQFKITIFPFVNQSGWKLLYTKTSKVKRNAHLIRGFVLRWLHIVKIISSDFVFIHREAAPIGPPVFEWIIAKLLMKRVIYDFDDAIWLTDKKEESAVTSLLRWRRKVKTICSFSYKVSCGNNYLQQYAAQYTRRSIVNPTTIDTQHLHNPALYNITKDKTRITIGWTGSHSTLKYLYLLQNVLTQLQQKYNNVDLLIIADQKPDLSVPRLLYRPWSKDTEVTDLLLSDIGIMPLPDDEWSKGKCGFKALQYMALEIPAVASPVGVNNTIIQHGVNGFLCHTETEWLTVLEELIQDEALRNKTGANGRKTVVDHYSVSSNARNFLSLFE